MARKKKAVVEKRRARAVEEEEDEEGKRTIVEEEDVVDAGSDDAEGDEVEEENGVEEEEEGEVEEEEGEVADTAADVDGVDSDAEVVHLNLSAGTYEHALYGYDCFVRRSELDPTAITACMMQKKYVVEAHSACVSAVGSGGRFVVTGSVDEHLRVYDVKKKVEVGLLTLHEGTINSIQLHEASSMLSASDDGTICIWDTKDWINLKSLKGHKAGVTSVAIHPSGKIAMSLSADRTIKTWNLLKGRCAYTASCSQVGNIVLWSPDGTRYVIVSDRKVEVVALATSSIVCSFEAPCHICDAVFIDAKHLALAGYSPMLYIVDTDTADVVSAFNAHETRVKGVCVGPRNSDGSAYVAMTADSDGIIKVWSCSELLSAGIQLDDEGDEEETKSGEGEKTKGRAEAAGEDKAGEKPEEKQKGTGSPSDDTSDHDNSDADDGADEDRVLPLAVVNTFSRLTCMTVSNPYVQVSRRTAMQKVKHRVRQELQQAMRGPQGARAAVDQLREKVQQHEEKQAKKQGKAKKKAFEVVPTDQPQAVTTAVTAGKGQAKGRPEEEEEEGDVVVVEEAEEEEVVDTAHVSKRAKAGGEGQEERGSEGGQAPASARKTKATTTKKKKATAKAVSFAPLPPQKGKGKSKGTRAKSVALRKRE